MHDSQNSPSQRPSQDYGAQDFLRLGADLEQRQQARTSAAGDAPDGAESWLFEGPEPPAPTSPTSGPAAALPAASRAPDEQGPAWLMGADEAARGSVLAGDEGSARRLDATYLEPDSSGEVIGRSLHRSLLPAASVVLLTVAGIGAWKMMGTGPMDSSEPAPIEFKAQQRTDVLVAPAREVPGMRDLAGERAPSSSRPVTSSPGAANAPARRPVVSPSEPSELTNWPVGPEEELADPFELSDDPARSAEAESTLDALDELVAGVASEPRGTGSPSGIEGLRPLSTVPPLNDPAVANGPAHASLLPPAAWAMPVALSTWSRGDYEPAALQGPIEFQDPVDLPGPAEEVLVAAVETPRDEDVAEPEQPEQLEQLEEPVEPDPIDAWLAQEGTVPFSALAQVDPPAPVVAVPDDSLPSTDEPLATFVPTDEPAASESAEEFALADGASLWPDDFRDAYDELDPVREEDVDELAEAGALDSTEPSGEELAAVDGEESSDEALFPWETLEVLAEEPAAAEVATVEVPAEVPAEPLEIAPVEELAAVDGEESSEETPFPWETLEVLAEEPAPEGLANEPVASVEEPDGTLVPAPSALAETPEFEPLAVVPELPEAPASQELPALDDELAQELGSGVIDPTSVDEEALVAAEEPPLELSGDEDLENSIADELDELAAEADAVVAQGAETVAPVAPVDTVEHERLAGVEPDSEGHEVAVDSVDGDWFLGGPVPGPDLPEGYALLEEDSTAGPVQDTAGPTSEETSARPRSALLGGGDLLGAYGDFLRSGRVPHGASPDLDVAAGEPVLAPEDEPRFDPSEVVPDRNGLARADSQQRWRSEEIPRHLYDSEERIFTPLVGDVRIELVGGDLLEGQLHSLGSGCVWVDSRAGRMQVEMDRVVTVQRLGTVGKVAASDPDKRDYSNLPHVRVRTAGGIIIGRQLARDGASVTVLTDAGIRMTLQSMDVSPANPRRAVVGLRPR